MEEKNVTNQMSGETFEVRDLRAKEKFLIDDKFLNGYAKILGTTISMVYINLCRHVDKNQKCFPKQSTIAKELSLSEPTVIEAIKVLAFFKLIKKQRIGKGCTNRYWLLDKKYWKNNFKVILNSLSSGDIKEFKFTTKTVLVGNLNCLMSNRKETQLKGNTIKVLPTKVDSKKYSFQEKLIKMQKDKKRHIQIIALYWKYKNYNLVNQEQYNSSLKRDLRSATQLIGYTDAKLSDVMDYLEENTTIKWTLETIGKFINEDLDNIEPMKKKYGNF